MKKLLPAGIILFGILSLGTFLGSFSVLRGLYALARESGRGAEQKPGDFNFSLYLPDNRTPFFTELIRGAEQAAAELNVTLTVHSVDPAKNELEMAAYTGADGIIVCPYLEESLARRQLEKLRGRIPVVLINLNLPGEPPWPYVGTGNYEIGRSIGTIAGQINPGAVRLAVVYSNKAPGIDAKRDLVEEGIGAVLGDRLAAPVLRLRTNPNLLDVEGVLHRLFRAAPGGDGPLPVNTLVFTNTTDTTAAAQPLIELNGAGSGLQVIGFGTSPEIESHIRAGVFACTIVTNPERIGGEALRSLETLCRTGYTSVNIDTGISIINAASLAR